MHAGALDLLHDTGHQVIGAVADGVNFTFGAVDVLIHQHRVAHVHMLGDNAHILDNIAGVIGHNHILTAQNVRRTHQDGVANLLGSLQGFVQGKDGAARRAGNAAAFQQLIKAFAVLGFIDGIGRGAVNGQADLIHMLCQLDGRLAAELHQAAVRLFGSDNMVNAFGVQRVKVQAVTGIKIGGNRFGVIVDQNGLAAVLFQRPDCVDRAVVELDALADADGAGAKDEDLLFVGLMGIDELLGLVLLIAGGVEVRGLGGKLGSAGIDHLEAADIVVHRQLFGTGQAQDGFIQEAVMLGLQILFAGQGAVFQAQLQVRQVLHLIQEPPVDLGDVIDGLVRHTALEGFVYAESALGVLYMQVLNDFLGSQLFKVGQGQGVHAQLNGADCLHHGVFKVVANGHHFAGGHHLGSQTLIGVNELIKRPFGVFDDHIVQRRLKAGAGFASHIVGDLVQRVAQGNLGCHLGDGIAGCLGGQRRGAGHTGVDLDDRILKAVRLEGKLAVAAALNAQLGDDIQRGGTQHLVFLIGQSLAGCHNDGVTGMHADRVQVFHVTYGDHIALVVTHHFVFDLFPTGDALFHKDLMDGGKTQAVGCDLVQLFRVFADTAAGTAHGESRAHDNGIADNIGKRHGSTTLEGMQGWFSFSMVSLNSWRSSARSMVSGLQASRRTPLRSKKPLRASSMERFRPIWPPRLGRMASGFSFSIMRSTTSAVSGSI